MRFPDFIIIGAAKAGTTSLYDYLCKHPQIAAPQKNEFSLTKEPGFFAFPERYAKGFDWYASLFNHAQKEQLCMEASTSYTNQISHRFQIPQLMAELVPNVKLIYIMRHPIDRAYSNYVQQIKAAQNRNRGQNLEPFKIPETFEQLLERGNSVVHVNDYMEKVDVVATSKYIDHINLYLEYFSSEQFLFLFFEDLCQNPKSVLHEILEFLEIDSSVDLTKAGLLKSNDALSHEKWYFRERVSSSIKSIPMIGNLVKLFPKNIRDEGYNFLTKINDFQKISDDYLPKPMLPETRKLLVEEFRDANTRLEQFLDKKLSDWYC